MKSWLKYLKKSWFKYLSISCFGLYGLILNTPVVLADPAGSSPPSKSSSHPSLTLPPPQTLIIIIRDVLAALNHANLTGNYSVLSQLFTPEARTANSPESLASNFAAVRAKNVDLGLILVTTPFMTAHPTLSPEGLLHLEGYFNTTPRLTFNLVYQFVENRWTPLIIGVGLASQEKALPPATLLSPSASPSPPKNKDKKPNK